MAPSSIKYFYSAYSAYAYIGHQDFMKIVHRSGSNVIHKPFDLMKCLNDIGYHQMEKRTAKTLEYQFGRQRDRWSEYRGVQIPKITPSTHNNGSEITDLILISAVQLGLNIDYLCYVFMQNHWINNLDLSNETALNDVLNAQGLDAKLLIKKAYSHETRDVYSSNTNDAIELSVFGSPTYVVNGDMFYGQDNLPLVERAIQQPFK